MESKKRKYKWTLRKYIAIVSILTFISSCIISTAITIGAIKIFYKEAITYEKLVLVCILILVLALIIAWFSLWVGAGHLTKPLIDVSNTVKQVAEGNFKVNIKRRNTTNCEYEYINEVDELAKNVNKMVAELDGMDYMRKDFMSNVSHEIKTPIAAITGFTEILLDGSIDESERQEYLEVINKESMRISRLCENMLHMSRLDSQVIVANLQKIRLDEQLRKCIILLSEKWSNKEIDFSIDLEEVSILSDYDMLQQVWINLIDNAIKYSRENCKIDISVKRLNDKSVKVSISDNGIGIEEGKLHRIFDKFYQCEESHKKSGSGLGLSISKRIVELLNGTIECKSKKDSGTTFEVTLLQK
ncbi:MAG: HAMP domain-containing sensor histidine kinase [Clostridium sp.]